MGLNLVVREGPRQGDQFRLLPGLTIGRSKGDIVLRDPKASTHHATVEAGPNGEFYLVDAGSANGIWVNEIKESRILLKSGVTLKIGSTILEVLEDYDLELSVSERDSWQGQLWGYFKSLASGQSITEKMIPSLFSPPIKLSFSRGPQTGEVWVVGYGPRKIGAGSLDLPIDDPSAPDFCFELIPDNQRVRFKTTRPDRIRLNDHAIESEILKDGDFILFGDNEIRVHIKPD